MNQKYNIIYRSELDESILNGTILTKEDIDTISKLQERFKKRTYFSAIEEIFKMQKNNYPTSKIGEMYGVSTRQIQRILKELGLNRDKSEAMLISLNCKSDSEGINTPVDSTCSASSVTQPSGRMAINELILPLCLEEFLNYLSTIKGKSTNTVAGYKMDLILFFRFMKRYKRLSPKSMPITDIYIGDIQDAFVSNIKLTDFYAFLSFLENERSNSSNARARKVASLKSFFKFLHTKAKIINENPTIELEAPKIVKRHPVYLSLEESKELLSAVEPDEKYHTRDFCIITLFLNCGVRLSELCSINISNIKQDVLTIIGKGNKERTVYLNKACIRAISDYVVDRNKLDILPSHKDALFISNQKCRINKSTVEKIVNKYLGIAGLDTHKYSPHKLRHTAATLMYKYGNVDIRSLQMILGHENINTTQIYTHVDDERLREAVSSNPLSEE